MLRATLRHLRRAQTRAQSTNEPYDLCVVGGGPAGFAAAMRAHDYGQRVVIVNSGRFGGAGLWDGALGSKTMWELSGKYITYRRAALKLTDTRQCAADFTPLKIKTVNDQVEQVCAAREAQMLSQLESLDIDLMQGRGKFVDPHTLDVEDEYGAKSTVTAKHFVIATGSRPRRHPTVQVDGKHVITSDHISQLDRFPDSMVILGAGVIGCEYATIFSKFKQTKVYLIDKADRILPFEDADIAGRAAASLKRRDVTIHEKATLQSMEVKDGMVHYVIADDKSGAKKSIRVETALLSIGRVPNVENLGLENAGVELKNGYIDCRDVVGTTAPHIAAVGDVGGKMFLVNVAEVAARFAVHRFFAPDVIQPHFLNKKTREIMGYSSIFFLDPEVAGVGLNEIQAQQAGISYKCAVYDYKLVSRALAMQDTGGCIKLLVTNDDKMKILGIRTTGPHASSLIEVVSLMIRSKRSIRDLAELLTAYPSMSEGLQECVRLLLGNSIFKPSAFPKELQVFSWEPGQDK